MRLIRWFSSSLLVASLAMLLAAGPAFADRGGRGHGGGGGGGGGGSSRSFSGGGGGGGGSSFRSSSGGGSSRSFSGGGSRSFSGGGGSSMRSFSGGGGGGGSSFRSFSGGNRASSSMSSRSFNMGDSGRSSARSMGGGDSTRSVRSFSGGDSGASARSFSRSNVGGGSDRSIRSFSGGDASSRSIGRNPSSQDVSRFLGNVSPGSSSDTPRTFRSEGNRTRSFSGLADGSSQNIGNSRSGRSFNSDTGAKVSDQGPRSYRSGRMSSDELRSFLDMRGNDNARLADSDKARIGDNNASRDTFRNRSDDNNVVGGGNTLRGNRDAGSDNKLSKVGRVDSNRLDDSLNRGGKDGDNKGPNGDRVNTVGDNGANRANRDARFGDRDGKLGDNRFGDRDGGPTGRDGKFADGKWNGRGDGDRKDKGFRGGDHVKRDFDKWSHVWRGKDGKGRDHRDWSGKWRDGWRFDNARYIRNHWWGWRNFDYCPFRGGWWGRGWGWRYWDNCALGFGRPWHWWGWTTCPTLTSWCNFGWSTPFYWDYGAGEYLNCYNGVVYVNGTWFQPAPVFYAQTLKLIDSTPVLTEAVAAKEEWLPLGVFAITPDGQQETKVLAQLAVTKEGVIGGTVFDQKVGKSYNVQGTVDKNSQRAVWSYTNDQNVRVVMETSVNNLTQNESTGMVHYGPNEQKVVQIVRLEDPSKAGANGAAADATVNQPAQPAPAPALPPQPAEPLPVPPPSVQ